MPGAEWLAKRYLPMMRRILVLTDETARHPFLADLPPHVRGEEAAVPSPDRNWRFVPAVTAEDVRGFLMAYCACLVAVATFIF
jgi:hypothetical protein